MSHASLNGGAVSVTRPWDAHVGAPRVIRLSGGTGDVVLSDSPEQLAPGLFHIIINESGSSVTIKQGTTTLGTAGNNTITKCHAGPTGWHLRTRTKNTARTATTPSRDLPSEMTAPGLPTYSDDCSGLGADATPPISLCEEAEASSVTLPMYTLPCDSYDPDRPALRDAGFTMPTKVYLTLRNLQKNSGHGYSGSLTNLIAALVAGVTSTDSRLNGRWTLTYDDAFVPTRATTRHWNHLRNTSSSSWDIPEDGPERSKKLWKHEFNYTGDDGGTYTCRLWLIAEYYSVGGASRDNLGVHGPNMLLHVFTDEVGDYTEGSATFDGSTLPEFVGAGGGDLLGYTRDDAAAIERALWSRGDRETKYHHPQLVLTAQVPTSLQIPCDYRYYEPDVPDYLIGANLGGRVITSRNHADGRWNTPSPQGIGTGWLIPWLNGGTATGRDVSVFRGDGGSTSNTCAIMHNSQGKPHEIMVVETGLTALEPQDGYEGVTNGAQASLLSSAVLEVCDPTPVEDRFGCTSGFGLTGPAGYPPLHGSFTDEDHTNHNVIGLQIRGDNAYRTSCIGAGATLSVSLAGYCTTEWFTYTADDEIIVKHRHKLKTFSHRLRMVSAEIRDVTASNGNGTLGRDIKWNLILPDVDYVSRTQSHADPSGINGGSSSYEDGTWSGATVTGLNGSSNAYKITRYATDGTTSAKLTAASLSVQLDTIPATGEHGLVVQGTGGSGTFRAVVTKEDGGKLRLYTESRGLVGEESITVTDGMTVTSSFYGDGFEASAGGASVSAVDTDMASSVYGGIWSSGATGAAFSDFAIQDYWQGSKTFSATLSTTSGMSITIPDDWRVFGDARSELCDQNRTVPALDSDGSAYPCGLGNGRCTIITDTQHGQLSGAGESTADTSLHPTDPLYEKRPESYGEDEYCGDREDIEDLAAGLPPPRVSVEAKLALADTDNQTEGLRVWTGSCIANS